VIPKSTSDANQLMNLGALSFKLTDEEVKEITKVLDTHNMLIKALGVPGCNDVFA
jgi:diketogulonate reductase-like aldo/keto reductase